MKRCLGAQHVFESEIYVNWIHARFVNFMSSEHSSSGFRIQRITSFNSPLLPLYDLVAYATKTRSGFKAVAGV
jgi:hypothetical protein